MNVSQTSAQVHANHTRQLVQFIEEQQDSGGMNITTDTAPAPLVDTSLRLEVGEGWQSGRGEGFSFSEDDDKREDCCNEEDDEAAHQVNESQTSAQVRADTRQLLQLIEEQKVSGTMGIETEVLLNLMVDTSLHLAVRSEGRESGHVEGIAILQSLGSSSTRPLAPSSPSSRHPTLAPCSSLDRAEAVANFPVNISNGMLVNAVGQYLDFNQAPNQLNDEELLELNEDVEPTSLKCSTCIQAAINLCFTFLLRIQATCNSCLRS